VPRSAALILFAVFAMVVGGAAAQTGERPPQTTPQQTPATAPQFVAGVDLVEVDVSVADKTGHPVTDLTARDFEISEDGQPQTIQAIYLASLNRTILQASAPLPAGATATDLPERRELKQRVLVFILDLAHLSPAGFVRSRDAIVGFIKDGMTPADLVGIVVKDKMLGNRIGSDKDALLKGLADVKGPDLSRFADMRAFPRIIDDAEAAKIAMNDQRTIDNAVARACSEQPGECRGAGGDGMVRQELEGKGARLAAETMRDTSITLKMLESLATGLARLPGPKQVAIFSEGFYTDDTASWLQSVVGLAARSSVHFSTFDARGLAKDQQSQNFLGAAPVTSNVELTPLGIDPNADVLTSLAVDTGGDRVFNYNNFREPLDKLVRETGTYYVIGYRPSKAFDGSYRHVDVKVLRPDVVVRARRGYVASRVSATPSSGASQPDEVAPGATAPAAAAPTGAPAASLPIAPAGALAFATGRSGIGAQPVTNDASPRGRPDSLDLVSTMAKTKAPTGNTTTDEANRQAIDGWQLYAQGHVEQARDKLAGASAAAPGLVWIQYALGQTEFTLEHFDAAIASFERVRRDLPEYEPVYFDLADSHLHLGQLGDALTVLREAEKRWPNDSETHNAAGCVLVRRNAFDDAASAFEKAIAAAPGDGLSYFNLARAYHLIFLRIVRSSSSNPTAVSMIADRNRQRAIDAYKKYLTIGGPFDEQARAALAGLGWK